MLLVIRANNKTSASFIEMKDVKLKTIGKAPQRKRKLNKEDIVVSEVHGKGRKVKTIVQNNDSQRKTKKMKVHLKQDTKSSKKLSKREKESETDSDSNYGFDEDDEYLHGNENVGKQKKAFMN